MASKQLGKLRQWAGEVILSRDKTTLSDEFQELEKDIELRRDGAIKLLAASGAYQHTLAKKKKNDAFEDSEKMLPIDTLGIVMIVHGEEFGDDSAFGPSLVKFGRAHCKVAALQEAFALTLKDTFLAFLEQYTSGIKDYEAHKKKLESRRLSYDAAVAKYEKLKNGKKEKEKREAEEEMETARDRYDETSEEVKAQMHAIQDKEMDQMRELTNFLDQEVHFVEQYLNVLKDVKSDWYDESSLMHVPPRRTSAPPHVFPHSRNSPESESELSRKLSKSPKSVSSKPPSRPASRSSRKRSDSGATIGEKDDKEKEKDKTSKRTGVAGWASSAMDSMTGRSKKKEKFSSLEADQPEGEVDEDVTRNSPSKKSSTFHSLTRRLSKSRDASPKSPPKILKPPYLLEKKLVRATHSFSGGVDELSFAAGEEIIVLNEVLDDWWMGELNGKKGLFPTSRVEEISKPVVPRRHKTSLRAAALSSPNDDASREYLDDDVISYSSNDFDDDHDFGRKPLSAHHTATFFNGTSDAASVISSLGGDEDDKLFVPFSRSADLNNGFDDDFQVDPVSKPSAELTIPRPSHIASPPSLPRRATEAAAVGSTASGKKPPPPPPPRRLTTTALGPSPPVPERLYKMKVLTPASVSSHDRSPFESVTELSTPDT
ncbi:Meiotically up-regulated gene 137 protein [Termitomyces sp. T112]|nr:Meiotically up-regulated gene 137 protein [Termitomyces sp. T112]KAH0579917.1 hypothetical protein H2248_002740 [Termitomyces sp. 'cryptogamus']